ncbi:MAG: alpha/beta hydrolase, partial [Olsenella sp.]|nr:alpha/beta hydrolase [Olsenella sp.]MCI2159542.1 alpha/beta hydrolase [Olsenella sp.]
VDWVGPESVPTIMAYGEKDKVAPFLSSVRLDAALTAAGVGHEYFVLPHSGHGLQDDDLFGQYMEAADRYLDTYLPVG